jgi:hypothetical protein
MIFVPEEEIRLLLSAQLAFVTLCVANNISD